MCSSGLYSWIYGLVLWCYSIVASYYAYRGGPSSDGYACGMFYIPFNGTPSFANWHRGAALCVHIILIVVVILTVVHFLVHSLFLFSLLLLILAGVLVLLYHLYAYTHYALRGGDSRYGDICGVFCILINTASNVTYWPLGTALLFCFILCYSWRAFKSW